jgi:hypothetical protein
MANLGAQRQANRGGGGNRNRGRNRGGGGGGGKKGRGGGGGGAPAAIAGVPAGGLYGGNAGEALTNQDPTSYWRSLLTRGGTITGTASPGDTYINEQGLPWLEDDYRQQLALNQNLSVADYTKNTYGAGYEGPLGQTANVGTLSLTGNTPFANRYQNWYSNESPISYATSELSKLGGYDSVGGNRGFQNFFQTDWVPQLQAGLETARSTLGTPALSMREYLQGQDLLGQAQRAYAVRPRDTRLPAPISQEGRYSWWS